MNSRKLFALFLVFALTGSALAAQQNQYLNTGLEADNVQAVQQHTVFVEIVVENKENRTQIHEFGAVVGLVKKCKQVRNVFDNAVLWFNDQFLFGDKQNERFNETPPGAMGFNPNRSHEGFDGDGFVERGNASTEPVNVSEEPKDKSRTPYSERWGGCFIPNGFMHAIGADDPFGVGKTARASATVNNDTTSAEADVDDATCTATLGIGPCDNVDYVKQIIDLDNTCGGCLIEYQSTFFITDPNDHQWMVDKLVYPISLNGNLFGEGSENCSPDNGTLISDPRDNYPHQDRCEDNAGAGDKDNHCTDDPDTGQECGANQNESGEGYSHSPGTLLVEPLYTVHVQVNPLSPTNQGFADEALWAYEDGTTRQGMPYPDDPVKDANYDECKADTDAHPCAIEYNFLLAVDFSSFDGAPLLDTGQQEINDGNSTRVSAGAGENEYRDNAVQHGAGAANHDDDAEDGNSHRHNAGDQVCPSSDGETCDPTGDQCVDPPNGVVDGAEPDVCHPRHSHSAVNLDLFFYGSAPFFVESNPYWDDFGAPPFVNDTCSEVLAPSDNATPAQATDQESAVTARTPIVCDVDADDGYHLHDGSQTIK